MRTDRHDEVNSLFHLFIYLFPVLRTRRKAERTLSRADKTTQLLRQNSDSAMGNECSLTQATVTWPVTYQSVRLHSRSLSQALTIKMANH